MAENYRELPACERVPEYHMQCPESAAIIETLAKYSLQARAAVFDMVDQFWVSTATWGLELWEQLVDIETDYTLSIEARRAAIITKLRGSGTCNAAMISSVAQAITGYEAKVVENVGDYSFSLVFVGDEPGFIDVDQQSIIDGVEEVKPAHLKFIIEGITWKDLHAVDYTWAMLEAEALTWHGLMTKVVVQKKE